MFNEESYYSDKNTCDNEDFRSIIVQPFTLQLPLYYILD